MVPILTGPTHIQCYTCVIPHHSNYSAELFEYSRQQRKQSLCRQPDLYDPEFRKAANDNQLANSYQYSAYFGELLEYLRNSIWQFLRRQPDLYDPEFRKAANDNQLANSYQYSAYFEELLEYLRNSTQ